MSAALDESQKRLLVTSTEFHFCFKWHILAFAGNKPVFFFCKEGWRSPGPQGPQSSRVFWATRWTTLSHLPWWNPGLRPSRPEFRQRCCKGDGSHFPGGTRLPKPRETAADGLHFNFRSCPSTAVSLKSQRSSSKAVFERWTNTFKADWSHRKYTYSITERKKGRDQGRVCLGRKMTDYTQTEQDMIQHEYAQSILGRLSALADGLSDFSYVWYLDFWPITAITFNWLQQFCH